MPSPTFNIRIHSSKHVLQNVPLESLKDWAHDGRLAPDDEICEGSTGEWMRVSQHPELAALFGDTIEVPIDTPSPSPEPQPAEPDPFQAEATRAVPAADGTEDEDDDLDAAGAWVTRRPSRRGEDVGLDMMPMIDIVFQLLIFFMLTNTMAQSSPLLVPEAKYGLGVNPEGKQVLLIDEQNRYYVGSRKSDEDIKPIDELIKVVAKNAQDKVEGSLDVIVTAHREARHRAVRTLIEELGKIENVGFVKLSVDEKR